MKPTLPFKQILVEFICLLYVLLFVYAAVSKLLDFENFQVQLGQSPLISSFAGWVAIGVPTVEIGIAILLSFPQHRATALWLSYTLMTMFTVYIYLILHYSTFIPCSCGGILEQLNWDQHLLFNIIFMSLALVALLFMPFKRVSLQYRIGGLLLGTFAGVGIVIGLYHLSENKMKYANAFVRRFPQHSAQEIHKIDLKFNSYYFAGSNAGKIYLGNHTAPFIVTILDTALQTQTSIKINVIQRELPFRSPTIKIYKTNFYLYEGSVPYIFMGTTERWTAALKMNSGFKFSQFEPLDSSNIAVRFSDPKTAHNILGTINLSDTTKVNYNTKLLEKQIDGIFDTDGQLHANTNTKQLIYLYLYRNQYVVANADLSLIHLGKTIDTTSKAKIKISTIKIHGITTLAAPPLVVNKSSSVNSDYLYSNAQLRGTYETDYLWKNNSVIDVYNLVDQSYQYSFAISNIQSQRIKSFLVIGNRFYALIGNQLVAYKLIDFKKNSNK